MSGLNLACSGAKTSPYTSSDGYFKPGLDFADNGAYYIQESLHPNYWAQMGLRSCVRQVWNGGAVRGGACTISGTGLVGGEPRMALS